jgi:hypothetical protein
VNDPTCTIYFNHLAIPDPFGRDMGADHRREAVLPGHDRSVAQRTANVRHQRNRQPKERRPVRVRGRGDQHFPWLQHLCFAQRAGDPGMPTCYTSRGTDTANFSHACILGRCWPTVPIDPAFWLRGRPNEVRWRDLPVRPMLDLALGDLWAEGIVPSKAP